MDTLDEISAAEYIERHPDSNAALHVREAAHAYSFGCFLAEFERGNDKIVETPQWPSSSPRSTILEYCECEADMAQMLDLIRLASKCSDIPVRLAAQAIVATLARKYADDIDDAREV